MLNKTFLIPEFQLNSGQCACQCLNILLENLSVFDKLIVILHFCVLLGMEICITNSCLRSLIYNFQNVTILIGFVNDVCMCVCKINVNFNCLPSDWFVLLSEYYVYPLKPTLIYQVVQKKSGRNFKSIIGDK